jgi:hypothetical protein
VRVLIVRPAHREPGDEPPVGQQVEGGQPLRDLDRPVVSGDEDAGADGDPLVQAAATASTSVTPSIERYCSGMGRPGIPA